MGTHINKKLPLLTGCLFAFLFTSTVPAQNTINYSYDGTGNRRLRVKEITLTKSEKIVATDSATSIPEDIPANTMEGTPPVAKGPDDIPVEPFEDLIGNEKILLYPNPTKGIVTIELVGYKAGLKVECLIYSYAGMLLAKSQNNSSTVQLNLLSYPSGMYILDIIIEGKKSQWKIIKE